MCAFHLAPLQLYSFVKVAKWLYVVHDRKEILLASPFLIPWLIYASMVVFLTCPPATPLGEKEK